MSDIQYYYLFVGDLITTPNRESLEIFEGVKLKIAPKLIKEEIKGMIPHREGGPCNLIEKYEFYKEDREGGGKYIIPLTDELQNYWIVEVNADIRIDTLFLKFALKLSKSNITTIYEGFVSKKRLCRCDISRYDLYAYSALDLFIEDEPKIITKENLHEIKCLYDLINNFDKEKYKYIWKAISDFRRVEFIMYPEFQYLSLISIIECLIITDNSEESITKQFVKKSIFILKRLKKPIEIKDYFKNSDIKLDKFLKLLYQYRSSIAHGDFPDFNGKLQEIKDTKILYNFLNDFVKELIVFAIEYPELISDIKRL